MLDRVLEVNKANYEQCGWCLFPQVLSSELIIAILEWLNAASTRAEQEPSLEPQFEEKLYNSRRHVRKIRRLLWNDRSFWGKILQKSGILDLGASFISGEPVIIRHAAFLKPNFIGSEVAFHQDQALWDRDYPGAISMWIALSQCNEQNGCIQLCPGSHREGLIPHQWESSYPWHPCISTASDNIFTPQPIPMESGDILVWHRNLVHGSSANLVGKDRKGMVLVFANATEPNFKSQDVFHFLG